MKPPADTTAAGYFGALVRDYDSLIRRAVPRYDEMIERLLDYLPGQPARVLELGCGTGNLSLRLATRYPAADLTLVDASPEMIAATRARLEEAGREARLVEARFEDLRLEPGAFDLAVSSISLHHVPDKAPLYRALHAALSPGGTFRFADQVRGGTGWNHERNWTRWLEFCRRHGNCSEDEVQSLLDHAEAHDHYTPLEEQFRLLSQAGFTGLDCVWRNWIWGIITADRPTGHNSNLVP